MYLVMIIDVNNKNSFYWKISMPCHCLGVQGVKVVISGLEFSLRDPWNFTNITFSILSCFMSFSVILLNLFHFLHHLRSSLVIYSLYRLFKVILRHVTMPALSLSLQYWPCQSQVLQRRSKHWCEVYNGNRRESIIFLLSFELYSKMSL